MNLERLAVIALAIVSTCLLAGCGGSSDNEPTYTTFTVFLAAEAAFEGSMGPGGLPTEVANGLTVGDREGTADDGLELGDTSRVDLL